ncbi:MAG: 50S ribosomal protein L17 [Planctomycetes bacterium]|nr:50S ribosomal protein L17 [Planctomycetota bacterium]
MRHRVAGNKLGRTSSHRDAMMRNMAVSLVLHERVVTTPAKAKVVKPFMEKLVTIAKKGDMIRRRRVFAQLRDKAATTKMFAVLGPRFASRPGGYCRILRLSKNRLGDNGERVILEFVERSAKEAPAAEAPAAAPAKGKKPAAKA